MVAPFATAPAGRLYHSRKFSPTAVSETTEPLRAYPSSGVSEFVAMEQPSRSPSATTAYPASRQSQVIFTVSRPSGSKAKEVRPVTAAPSSQAIRASSQRDVKNP